MNTLDMWQNITARETGFHGVTGVARTLRDPGQAVCSSTQRRRASRGTRTARPTRSTGKDPERRSS